MFYLMALDKDFNMITPLYPTNIQWNRKYHAPGSFSIQLPLEQYSADIKYIYTKDRPELGKVSQLNYMSQDGYQRIQLSGFFVENELNRHVAYPPGMSNMITSPAWVERTGNAEDVAYAFFEGFRAIGTSSYGSVLDISADESMHRGNEACHHRNGEELGAKLYDILKPSGMSYRVRYDFETNAKRLRVWCGKDCTHQNADGNNPVVFSTKYGNIKNPNVLYSEDTFKNACIVTNEQTDGETTTFTSRFVMGDKFEGAFKIGFLNSSLNKNDYSSEDFAKALDGEGKNYLAEHAKIINVEFDTFSGSYEYMKDFDLGDKCSLDIPEIEFASDARIIACYEVIKAGQWMLSLEFGTPIIKKGGRK